MKINHRRKNPPRYPNEPLHNGYAPGRAGVGKPWHFIDKSMHGWAGETLFADKRISAGIGNDFTDGHRGMARAVRGAKKFVRSRIRAANKMKLKKVVEHENCRNDDTGVSEMDFPI